MATKECHSVLRSTAGVGQVDKCRQRQINSAPESALAPLPPPSLHSVLLRGFLLQSDDGQLLSPHRPRSPGDSQTMWLSIECELHLGRYSTHQLQHHQNHRGRVRAGEGTKETLDIKKEKKNGKQWEIVWISLQLVCHWIPIEFVPWSGGCYCCCCILKVSNQRAIKLVLLHGR